jgi:hypothetical protein
LDFGDGFVGCSTHKCPYYRVAGGDFSNLFNGPSRYDLSMNQVDFRDPEAMKSLRGKRLCDKIVRDAAEILDALFLEAES